MADKRPWAKIDAGYMMNRKWFQIERSMRTAMPNALPIAMRTAMRLARECHMASILYCVQGSTDGEFPVSAVKAIVGVTEPDEEVAITALFESGMWINKPGGMAEVKDFLDHQTPSDKVRQKSEAGKKGAAVRWGKNADRNADRNAEEKRREEKRSNTPYKSPTGDPNTKPKRRTYSDEFARFWDAFPSERKADKPKCADKFAAAVSTGVTAECIIQAAERYRDDPNREPAFTVNPHRWLNEERWEAGPLPPRGGQQSRSQQAWEADMRQILAEEQGGQLQIGGSL